MKSQRSEKPNYYLDTNAWINLRCHQTAIDRLTTSHSRGDLNINLMQQNLDELLDEAKVSRDNLQANRKLLSPFLSEKSADKIFILGSSKLDLAQLSDEPEVESFRRHLGTKSTSPRNVRDGIHLVNAIRTKSTFVTCDGQLIQSSKREQITSICLAQFARSEALGQEVRCTGCSVRETTL